MALITRISLVLASVACAVADAQNLSLKIGTPFNPGKAEIVWQVPSNAVPSNVRTFKLLPNHFSSQDVSNLLMLCPFTERERVRDDADWLVFQTVDGSRRLGILYPLGSIEYRCRELYTPTNLVQALPTREEAIALATNVLSKIGIDLSEIAHNRENSKLEARVADATTIYFVKGTFITNITSRTIRLRRAIDGTTIIGNGTGGNCEVEFGDHAKIIKLSVSWRRLDPQRTFPTARRETLVRWIQKGKAVYGPIPGNLAGVDWKRAHMITIKKAELAYYAGTTIEPSDWAIPIASLWATVSTSHGDLDLEIDCPVIDETSR